MVRDKEYRVLSWNRATPISAQTGQLDQGGNPLIEDQWNCFPSGRVESLMKDGDIRMYICIHSIHIAHWKRPVTLMRYHWFLFTQDVQNAPKKFSLQIIKEIDIKNTLTQNNRKVIALNIVLGFELTTISVVVNSVVTSAKFAIFVQSNIWLTVVSKTKHIIEGTSKHYWCPTGTNKADDMIILLKTQETRS